MKRIRVRKHFSFNRINLLCLSFILIILGIVFAFRYVNKHITPIMMDYASLEARKLSSIIINKAISKHITEKVNSDELFAITKESNGEIRAIDFNTAVVNKFLTETTNSVQINLRNIEKGDIDSLEFSDSVLVDYNKEKLEKGIIYEVSSGVLIGNPILANIGPKIPVKISLVGDATSNISTEVDDYGVNNALLSVYVNLKVSEKVILPFYDEIIEIDTKVPVAMKIVTGTVPKYYANGLNQSTPSIVVENDEKK